MNMSDYNMIKSSSGIFLQQVFEGDSCVNNEAERCSVSAMNKRSDRYSFWVPDFGPVKKK